MNIYQIVESFSRIMDLRSIEESDHGRRTSKYCILLAEDISMPVTEIENLAISSRLHDIGKVGVRGFVLSKAAPLTDGEWAMIKKHPLFSYEILKPLGIDPSILTTVLQHHENEDGSGYPNKTKGGDIIKPAKILRIADVFDSLTSDRPYRKAYSKDTAIDIMFKFVNCFDPLLLDRFSRLESLTDKA